MSVATFDSAIDVTLMRRVQAGDTAAFAALYDRHATAVFGVAHRMLRDRLAAEDATQETFLAVWRRRDRFSADRGAPRAWLLTIARNCAIDVVRRRRNHLDQPLGDTAELLASPDRTDDEVMRRADVATMGLALDELPDPQRQVLDLAYFAGLTHTEIATQLDVPLGTVKGRMRLGLHKLAGHVEPPAAAALA